MHPVVWKVFSPDGLCNDLGRFGACNLPALAYSGIARLSSLTQVASPRHFVKGGTYRSDSTPPHPMTGVS